MLKFLARFIFFNIATLIVWFFIHFYYEALLWFFTIKTSQVFGPITLTDPEVINGDFICRLGKVTSHFTFPSLMVVIFITIPLLLSTSGISFLNRAKMVIIGLFFVFLFQIFLLRIAITFEIYQDYPELLQKGRGMEQIIAYTRTKHLMFLWLNLIFKSILQFVVAVGIWVGLVSYYKRSHKQGWIQKLF
jgi:hypothetical protein